jgi:uncharacterized protein (TIGR02145 family)
MYYAKMKVLITALVVAVFSLPLSAQQYTLTFEAIDHQTSALVVLDSIQVDGYDHGFDTTLIGASTLVISTTTDVAEYVAQPDQLMITSVAYRMLSNESIVDVISPKSSVLSLSLFNMLGVQCMTSAGFVTKGVNRYRISTGELSSGTYILVVEGAGQVSAVKLLCIRDSHAGEAQIVNEGVMRSGSGNGLPKCSTTNYRFVGYSSGYLPDTLDMAIEGNKTVVFELISEKTEFSISGRITGNGVDVSGISVSVGARQVSTDPSGEYRIENVSKGSYTITPTKTGMVFDPLSKNVMVDQGDVENVDFVAKRESSGETVTDIDGNVYETIKIGDQVWMLENLKTTKYNDGTPIPNPTIDNDWAAATGGGYCWYQNDESANKTTYGALYNWYAVNTGKLAPEGWHVPSDEEWKTLEMTLGMSRKSADSTNSRGTDVGGKLKEAGTDHWHFPNIGATNSSGFTALPGGNRWENGTFSKIRDEGSWWTSTPNGEIAAWLRNLDFIDAGSYRGGDTRGAGYSVRCIKNQ